MMKKILIVFAIFFSSTLSAQLNYKGDSLTSRIYAEKFCKANNLPDSVKVKLENILFTKHHTMPKGAVLSNATVSVSSVSEQVALNKQANVEFENKLETLLGKKLLTKFEDFLYNERELKRAQKLKEFKEKQKEMKTQMK